MGNHEGSGGPAERLRAAAIQKYAGTLGAAGVRLAEAVRMRDWSLATRTADRMLALYEMSGEEVIKQYRETGTVVEPPGPLERENP